MKKILTLIALAFLLPIQLHAEITEPIRYSIQKSRPDLLKRALDGQTLTDEQKSDCLRLANEVLRIREEQMNINIVQPKKLVTPGRTARIGGVLVGVWGILSLISFFQQISETEDPDTGFCLVALMVFWESLMAVGARKLWKHGEELDVEFFKSYRSSKQKYFDALETNEILAKL